jgi:tRNA A37 threonylcarbamoyladenosine biosynthesis protein TsaE
VHEYDDGRIPLRHADLYRIEDEKELDALGLGERVGVEGVWVVEWPERAEGWFGVDCVRVRIELAGDDARSVSIEGLREENPPSPG